MDECPLLFPLMWTILRDVLLGSSEAASRAKAQLMLVVTRLIRYSWNGVSSFPASFFPAHTAISGICPQINYLSASSCLRCWLCGEPKLTPFLFFSFSPQSPTLLFPLLLAARSSSFQLILTSSVYLCEILGIPRKTEHEVRDFITVWFPGSVGFSIMTKEQGREERRVRERREVLVVPKSLKWTRSD